MVDFRPVGYFLVTLVIVVMLFGDPRAGASPESSSGSASELCAALDTMAVERDRLVDGAPDATVAGLKDAAREARDVGAATDGLDTAAAAGLDYFTGLFLDLPAEPTTRELLSASAPATVTARRTPMPS